MEKGTQFEYLDYQSRERSLSAQFSNIYSKVNVGIQSITPIRVYVMPKIAASHRLSMIDYPKLLYMPHTVTFLILSLALVIYFSLKENSHAEPFLYVLRRLLKVCVIVKKTSYLQTRSFTGPMSACFPFCG